MSEEQVDVSLCPWALYPGEALALRWEVSDLTIDAGIMRTRTREPPPAGTSTPGTVKRDQTPEKASFLPPRNQHLMKENRKT